MLFNRLTDRTENTEIGKKILLRLVLTGVILAAVLGVRYIQKQQSKISPQPEKAIPVILLAPDVVPENLNDK